MTTDADAMVILANSIDLLSQAIDKLADSSFSPGGAAAAPSQPPGSPSGPPSAPPGGQPKGEKTIQQKRGGLIFLTAKDHNMTAAGVAAHVFGDNHGRDPDARNWSDADQQAVLDSMKDWGWLPK